MWAAAVVGSNNAAGYQLATELPVMAVGGFNGTDPAPTLEQFQQYVADGKIHYFIGGPNNAGRERVGCCRQDCRLGGGQFPRSNSGRARGSTCWAGPPAGA